MTQSQLSLAHEGVLVNRLLSGTELLVQRLGTIPRSCIAPYFAVLVPTLQMLVAGLSPLAAQFDGLPAVLKDGGITFNSPSVLGVVSVVALAPIIVFILDCSGVLAAGNILTALLEWVCFYFVGFGLTYVVTPVIFVSILISDLSVLSMIAPVVLLVVASIIFAHVYSAQPGSVGVFSTLQPGPLLFVRLTLMGAALLAQGNLRFLGAAIFALCALVVARSRLYIVNETNMLIPVCYLLCAGAFLSGGLADLFSMSRSVLVAVSAAIVVVPSLLLAIMARRKRSLADRCAVFVRSLLPSGDVLDVHSVAKFTPYNGEDLYDLASGHHALSRSASLENLPDGTVDVAAKLREDALESPMSQRIVNRPELLVEAAARMLAVDEDRTVPEQLLRVAVSLLEVPITFGRVPRRNTRQMAARLYLISVLLSSDASLSRAWVEIERLQKSKQDFNIFTVIIIERMHRSAEARRRAAAFGSDAVTGAEFGEVVAVAAAARRAHRTALIAQIRAWNAVMKKGAKPSASYAAAQDYLEAMREAKSLYEQVTQRYGFKRGDVLSSYALFLEDVLGDHEKASSVREELENAIEEGVETGAASVLGSQMTGSVTSGSVASDTTSVTNILDRITDLKDGLHAIQPKGHMSTFRSLLMPSGLFCACAAITFFTALPVIERVRDAALMATGTAHVSRFLLQGVVNLMHAADPGSDAAWLPLLPPDELTEAAHTHAIDAQVLSRALFSGQHVLSAAEKSGLGVPTDLVGFEALGIGKSLTQWTLPIAYTDLNRRPAPLYTFSQSFMDTVTSVSVAIDAVSADLALSSVYAKQSADFLFHQPVLPVFFISEVRRIQSDLETMLEEDLDNVRSTQVVCAALLSVCLVFIQLATHTTVFREHALTIARGWSLFSAVPRDQLRYVLQKLKNSLNRYTELVDAEEFEAAALESSHGSDFSESLISESIDSEAEETHSGLRFGAVDFADDLADAVTDELLEDEEDIVVSEQVKVMKPRVRRRTESQITSFFTLIMVINAICIGLIIFCCVVFLGFSDQVAEARESTKAAALAAQNLGSLGSYSVGALYGLPSFLISRDPRTFAFVQEILGTDHGAKVRKDLSRVQAHSDSVAGFMASVNSYLSAISPAFQFAAPPLMAAQALKPLDVSAAPELVAGLDYDVTAWTDYWADAALSEKHRVAADGTTPLWFSNKDDDALLGADVKERLVRLWLSDPAVDNHRQSIGNSLLALPDSFHQFQHSYYDHVEENMGTWLSVPLFALLACLGGFVFVAFVLLRLLWLHTKLSITKRVFKNFFVFFLVVMVVCGGVGFSYYSLKNLSAKVEQELLGVTEPPLDVLTAVIHSSYYMVVYMDGVFNTLVHPEDASVHAAHIGSDLSSSFAASLAPVLEVSMTEEGQALIARIPGFSALMDQFKAAFVAGRINGCLFYQTLALQGGETFDTVNTTAFHELGTVLMAYSNGTFRATPGWADCQLATDPVIPQAATVTSAAAGYATLAEIGVQPSALSLLTDLFEKIEAAATSVRAYCETTLGADLVGDANIQIGAPLLVSLLFEVCGAVPIVLVYLIRSANARRSLKEGANRKSVRAFPLSYVRSGGRRFLVMSVSLMFLALGAASLFYIIISGHIKQLSDFNEVSTIGLDALILHMVASRPVTSVSGFSDADILFDTVESLNVADSMLLEKGFSTLHAALDYTDALPAVTGCAFKDKAMCEKVKAIDASITNPTPTEALGLSILLGSYQSAQSSLIELCFERLRHLRATRNWDSHGIQDDNRQLIAAAAYVVSMADKDLIDIYATSFDGTTNEHSFLSGALIVASLLVSLSCLIFVVVPFLRAAQRQLALILSFIVRLPPRVIHRSPAILDFIESTYKT